MTTSIYGRAAAIYRNHGWQGVLPLPPEQKAHPPTGYTGASGVDPDQAQIDLWCRTQDEGNIALRLPDGVIGIDVDAYLDKHGDVSLLALQTELGLLPPTWRSTSRGLGHSGIYLFRVPPGRYQDQPAPAIEIIQHHHRYMVVMPSIHPEGRPYLWYDPDGVEQHRPPNIDELPWLPDLWVTHLAVKQRAEQTYEPRTHQVDDWTAAVTRAFTKALMDMPGGRHNAAMRGALALLRLLALEHPGADMALTELGARFRTAIGDRSSPGQAEKEWSDLVQGAIGIVRETPSEAPKWEPSTPRPEMVEWWDVGKDVPEDDDEAPKDRFRSNLYTVDQLRDIPPPEPLIAGILDKATLAFIRGKPGAYKTFIGLDFSLSVATGTWWLGKYEVTAGPVVYVVAEGQAGFWQRIDSWQRHHNVNIDCPLRVLTIPVNLYEAAQAGQFLNALDEQPALIVFDTLARCTVGADENSARDMGIAVANLDHIIRQTGACVTVVHHNNRAGVNLRGSSVLDGAADTILAVTVDEQLIEVTPDKQKHHRLGPAWRLTPVEVGDSVAIDRYRGQADGLPGRARRVLQTLKDITGGGPVTSSEWKVACPPDISERSFYRTRSDLIELEYVGSNSLGRGSKFSVTDKGCQALWQEEMADDQDF